MEDFEKLFVEAFDKRCSQLTKRKFEFFDHAPITFEQLTKDPMLMAEALGLEVEFVQLTKGMARPKQKKVWMDLHEKYKEQKEYDANIARKDVAMGIGYQLLIDVEGTKERCKLLYDCEHKKLANITWDAFIQYYSKEEKEALEQEAVLCNFFFNPKEEHLKLDDSDGRWLLNKFVPPGWEDKDIEAVLPKEVEFVLNHLFADDVSREYAEKWLYQAFTIRNQHYLVLNGGLGIGKGLFVSLAMSLVGFENSNTTTGGFLSTVFNDPMRHKRLLFLDEEVVTKKNKHRIKKYINNMLSFEGKGKSVTELEDNHCSFIVANNNITDVHVEGQDRRFAVMELTETSLPEVLSQEEIDSLAERFEDPDSELIAQFGNYLKEKYEGTDPIPQVPPKGPTFWKLVHASYTEWGKIIVNYSDKGEIRVKALRELAKKLGVNTFPSNYAKIEDFLRNCIAENGDRLGVLEVRKGEEYIVYTGHIPRVETEEDADLPYDGEYDL